MKNTNPTPSTNSTVAPSFAAKTLDGKDIKLEDYRGKVVMLYFWATWCKPCVAGSPKLKKGYKDLKASFGDDFEMISLSMDDYEQSVRQHVNKHKLTWPQVRIGHYSKIASDYGVEGAPQYFLIGTDGKILLSPESPQVDTKSFIEEVLKKRKL
jgi:peroxiredoxin